MDQINLKALKKAIHEVREGCEVPTAGGGDHLIIAGVKDDAKFSEEFWVELSVADGTQLLLEAPVVLFEKDHERRAVEAMPVQLY